MTTALEIQDFLDASKEGQIIDVRSPSEFSAGHIPGAVNVPLFSDDERARVGLCYKEQGHDEAVLLGLEIVGPKMRTIAEQVAAAVPPEHRVLVHCWRGGMRSSSVCWLLEQTGHSPELLVGGYKSFRRAAHEAFAAERNLIVLTGMTGAGKTIMLHRLAEDGEQVLDLEGLANHRGSSFGAIGLRPQPTVEQFENTIYQQLRSFDKTRPVWVEDESRLIGRIRVPDSFWDRMRDSPAILMEASRETRAANLVEEYGELDKTLLGDATRRLEKKLGGLRMSEILDNLAQDNTFDVAIRLLEYYDKAYQHSADRDPRQNVFRIAEGSTPAEVIQLGRDSSDKSASRHAL